MLFLFIQTRALQDCIVWCCKVQNAVRVQNLSFRNIAEPLPCMRTNCTVFTRIYQISCRALRNKAQREIKAVMKTKANSSVNDCCVLSADCFLPT